MRLATKLFGRVSRVDVSNPSRPFYSSNGPSREETIEGNFEAQIARSYKDNGVVFTCILARMLPFSEARFIYQSLVDGRPGELVGGDGLGVLEEPWENGSTGDLLSRMEQDVSLGGNAYVTIVNGPKGPRLRRLRPDWVAVLSGVRNRPELPPTLIDAEVLGYTYKPPGEDGVVLSPRLVAHYAPIPDPEAQWRGMSWLTPIAREIAADSSVTQHKKKFFDNGTIAGAAIVYDKDLTDDQLDYAMAKFREAHTGPNNAYKWLQIGGGADVKTVGASLEQLDFKAVQTVGENRIAAAAGVGAIIARLSSGMEGSSLNAGNYSAAKRQFADMTLRPLWRSAAASLAKFAKVPPGHRLWTDTRDVAFLKEDEKDQAQILSVEATSVRALIDAGFEPDAAIDAVKAGDLALLRGKHSGLYSVQLQEPGSATQTTA